MLLPRIWPTLRSSSVLSRANSTSAGSALYHPKVRAFPFAISKEDAITRLGPFTSFQAAGKGLLGSLGARYLPGFGFKSFEPVQSQAAYLPVWMIDAEVEAKVWLPQKSGADPSPQTAFAHVLNCYMPGFELDPLSRVSFNDRDFVALESVPFSDDLKYQHGSEVLCPPFEFAPFLLPDLAKSISYKQAVFSKSFRFEPSSVKVNLMAAYPVLLPVYLFLYELTSATSNNPAVILTVIREATCEKGATIVNNVNYVGGPAIKTTSAIANKLIAATASIEFLRHKRTEGLDATSFVNVFGFSDVHDEMARRRDFVEWVNNWAKPKSAMQEYRRLWKERYGDLTVDFDDLRVRVYHSPERRPIRLWMRHVQMERSLQKAVDTLKGMTTGSSDESPGSVYRFGSFEFRPGSVNQFQEQLKKQLEEAKKQRQASTPEWFRQWEEEQESKGSRK